MSTLRDITRDEFDNVIADTAGLLIIDFWAPWCAPCRAMIPILEELADEYAGRVTFAKMNVDDDPIPAVEMGVRGVPTIVLFMNGVEVDRVVGAECRTTMGNRIERHLAGARSRS